MGERITTKSEPLVRWPVSEVQADLLSGRGWNGALEYWSAGMIGPGVVVITAKDFESHKLNRRQEPHLPHHSNIPLFTPYNELTYA